MFLINWCKSHSSVLLIILISLLMVDVVIDPSNLIFGIKYLLFGFTFLVWVFFGNTRIQNLPHTLRNILIFIALILPLYALSVGLIRNYLNNSALGSVIYFNSFLFFLLILIIYQQNINLRKIFNASLFAIVILTLCAYSVYLIYPNIFGFFYTFFVEEKDVAVFAFRSYGDYKLLMMFYKTSPLLVFPLAYYLHQLLIRQQKSKIIPQIIILISIILTLIISGTRANMLATAFIILFYLGFYAYKNSKKSFLLLSILYLIIGLYAFIFIWNNFLDANELSNRIKFGHIESYMNHFSDDWSILIFGQGLGSSFFSKGFQSLTNVTELSYFEFLRIWGLPLTIVFIGVLFLPIIHAFKTKKINHLLIAYIAYLFVAGTNPLLLSSTGMIVLVYVFSEMFKSLEGQRLKRSAVNKN